jgi:predicted ATP-dependent endonuclease of OLD family
VFLKIKGIGKIQDSTLELLIQRRSNSTVLEEVIIKRLLELGEIKEKDVLIFDEPEIHLHPAWQIKFAEILILLQKEFNLTILLTTHSPYFLNAIEVFSKKYDAQKKCKFYLAKSNDDVSDVDDVTENIDEVYQQMSLPFKKLDDIAYADDEFDRKFIRKYGF